MKKLILLFALFIALGKASAQQQVFRDTIYLMDGNKIPSFISLINNKIPDDNVIVFLREVKPISGFETKSKVIKTSINKRNVHYVYLNNNNEYILINDVQPIEYNLRKYGNISTTTWTLVLAGTSSLLISNLMVEPKLNRSLYDSGDVDGINTLARRSNTLKYLGYGLLASAAVVELVGLKYTRNNIDITPVGVKINL